MAYISLNIELSNIIICLWQELAKHFYVENLLVIFAFTPDLSLSIKMLNMHGDTRGTDGTDEWGRNSPVYLNTFTTVHLNEYAEQDAVGCIDLASNETLHLHVQSNKFIIILEGSKLGIDYIQELALNPENIKVLKGWKMSFLSCCVSLGKNRPTWVDRINETK